MTLKVILFKLIMSLDLKILLTFILCLHVINAEEGRIQVRLSGGLVEGRVVKFGDREALAFMVTFFHNVQRITLILREFRLPNHL